MPRHNVHRQIDRMFLGKEYPDVHKLLDYPSRWLGKDHRVLFHDPKLTPLQVLLLTGDPNKMMSAYLHIQLDKLDRYLKTGKW